MVTPFVHIRVKSGDKMEPAVTRVGKRIKKEPAELKTPVNKHKPSPVQEATRANISRCDVQLYKLKALGKLDMKGIAKIRTVEDERRKLQLKLKRLLRDVENQRRQRERKKRERIHGTLRREQDAFHNYSALTKTQQQRNPYDVGEGEQNRASESRFEEQVTQQWEETFMQEQMELAKSMLENVATTFLQSMQQVLQNIMNSLRHRTLTPFMPPFPQRLDLNGFSSNEIPVFISAEESGPTVLSVCSLTDESFNNM